MTTLNHEALAPRMAGAPLEEARAAMLLVHGRGARAEGMFGLADELGGLSDVALIAPQADGHTWYPHSFLAPLAQNEPGLSSGLRTLAGCVDRLAEAGVPPERVLLVGFSQGACLALEFAARNARRYGGVAALSGGLIGNGERPGIAPPADKTYDYDGDLGGTPIFLGCSDVDTHIPLARVHTSAGVLETLGGDVTTRIYPGMGHTINRDELDAVRALLDALLQS